MNLISDSERAIYEAALQDVVDTFARPITVTNSFKVPKPGLSDNNDDYDFTQNVNVGNEEFEYQYVEKTVLARVKYLDKQDAEFSMILSQRNEQLDVSQDFGTIRIKVSADDCDTVSQGTTITVDGNVCVITFRDRPHGLFASKYCTFYLQRTP